MNQQIAHGGHEHHDHDHSNVKHGEVITREQLFAQLDTAFKEADVTARNELSRAGVLLVVDQPFFGAIYSLLKKVPTMALPTMATDGLHIFYNPFWINTLERRDLPGLLGHECMHVVLDHAGRLGKRDKDRWNAAGDYVINLILKEAGLSVPPEGLFDARYKGKTTEQVYDMLPESQKSGGGGGKKDKGGCDHCDGLLDPAPPEEVPSHMKPEQIAITAATAAKSQGKLPASLEKLLEDIINPKIAWQKILRNFACVNNKDNYTWLKGNRRYLPRHYLPTLHGQQVGECAVVFDTSGSVSDKEATAFLSEMTAILRDLKPKKIHFIQCDAKVQSHQELTVYDLPLKVTIKGRGGTAFTPPFKYIAKQGINPRFLIYMTDGHANDFPAAPNYPVMWVTTAAEKFPWGEILKLSLDE